MVLGLKEFSTFSVFPCIAYGKVGEMVTTKAGMKQNWLYQFYLKGNPQLTIQTSFVSSTLLEMACQFFLTEGWIKRSKESELSL